MKPTRNMLRQLEATVLFPLEVVGKLPDLLLNLLPCSGVVVAREQLLSEAVLAGPSERIDLGFVSRSPEDHLHAKPALVYLLDQLWNLGLDLLEDVGTVGNRSRAACSVQATVSQFGTTAIARSRLYSPFGAFLTQ